MYLRTYLGTYMDESETFFFLNTSLAKKSLAKFKKNDCQMAVSVQVPYYVVPVLYKNNYPYRNIVAIAIMRSM